MTWFPDLGPCTYFLDSGQALRAVGWLAAGQAFVEGAIDPAVLRRLAQLLQAPWQPFVFAGAHSCELCGHGYTKDVVDGLEVDGGWANLFVPSPRDAFVYAAPSMIVHYVVRHAYAPPGQFCKAVLACPEPGSAEYFLALLERGPSAELWRRGVLWGVEREAERRGPLGSSFERLMPLALETLRGACMAPEHPAQHHAVTAAKVLRSIGLVARPAIPDLEAAVRVFPDVDELEVALRRLRDPFGDGEGLEAR